jgi:thiol:disulfide interchange protein DsbG
MFPSFRLPCLASLVLLAALTAFAAQGARAQDAPVPTMPKPIESLAAQGAQVRYMGKAHGMDSWLTIQRGQEQYFYVLPDGEAFLMGLLFNKDGKLVTVEQINTLRKESGEVLDMLADDEPAGIRKKETSREFKTPAERLYADVEDSNWVTIGNPKAPFLYVFMDPQCPHCHAFFEDVRKPYIETGKLQMRLIPVGFKDETRAQAAFLLASGDPETRWLKHMDGDKTALPAKAEVSQQGIQMNMAVMQSWKLDATPIAIYRDKKNEIKIVRGRAKDIDALFNDLRAPVAAGAPASTPSSVPTPAP